LRHSAVYLGWRGSDVSQELERLVAGRYDVLHAEHYGFGDDVDQSAIAPDGADYLFSFGPVIVRRPLLDRIRVAAINFHTAPPRWPGRGSVSFALYHGDREFGVTAHLMTEAVDAGAILRVLRFPIEPGDTVASLDAKTKSEIVPLATAVLDDLERNDGRPVATDERWERPALTLRDMEALLRIEDDDDEDIVRRKIRAFAHPTKPGPYLERSGFRFWYVDGEA
jgi:methionyl-tRNA formyltransferase